MAQPVPSAPIRDETETGQAAELMEKGEHAQALLLLERIVLIDPTNAGAWLDMAIASHRLGDHTTSEALLRHVESEFNPSPAIRAVIAHYRDSRGRSPASAPAPPLKPRWTGELALLAGRETNINWAPGIDSLTLTFGGTPVSLPLAPEYQPRASNGVQIEARGEGDIPLGEGGLRALGHIEWKQSRPAAAPEFGVRQFQTLAGLRGTWPNTDNGWIVLGGQQRVVLGSNTLFQSQRLQGVLERKLLGCRLTGGLEGEARRFPTQPILDSRYRGLLGGLACAGSDIQVAVNIRLGSDEPDGDRPGGPQRRADLALVLQKPLGNNRHLEFLAATGYARDRDSYSPLFDNIVRQTRRDILRLEYFHPLSSGWELALRGEIQRQQSNLDLFNIRNSSLLAGIRKAF
ncbi:MAG: tetratricopeptide repeat protein [Sulfurisoma sp.]|nr:tetratricopeptide repeat protein [Sulfurisoma sp.]